MSNPAQRVWKRISENARHLALQKSIPSLRHAEAIVAQLMREEGVEPPPQQTLTEIAKELLAEISAFAA